MGMIYGSVCSGVEAATLAWEPLGWKPAFFAEIEPFPSAVLKHRWPHVPNLGDFTKIKGDEYRGTVELVVGGTPCQGFSIAGTRKGMDDERSCLAGNFLELADAIRPRWVVWENVPGVLSSWNGDADGEAAEQWVESSDFDQFTARRAQLGYGLAWRILDAQYVRVDGFGRAVPQRRRRVFVVGYRGDWRPPAAVLLEPGCLSWDSPPQRKARTGAAQCVAASTGGASAKEQQHTFIGGNGEPLNPICLAHGQSGAEIVSDGEPSLNCDHEAPILCQSVRLRSGCEGGGKGALVGEERSHSLTSSNDQTIISFFPQKKAENMLPLEDISGTVCNGAAPGFQNAVCYENHGHDGRVKNAGPVSPAINAKAGSGGNNLPLVSFGFLPGQGHGAKGIGFEKELSPTLRGGCDSYGLLNNTVVRRLTPLECERLMGFPDNHTRIPWRGRTAEQCPDGPRYKACGNSMCVNVMRWLGRRIQMAEECLEQLSIKNES